MDFQGRKKRVYINYQVFDGYDNSGKVCTIECSSYSKVCFILENVII